MFKFKTVRNQKNEIDFIETNLTGHHLLNSARLNKGCAFSLEERDQFDLTGLLPDQVETLAQQVARMYVQYHEHHTNLGKNIYLNVLHDYNETLFYKLVSEHLEEMLPIIYTPTVGEAVQRFSAEHRKPQGLYISYPHRHRIDDILANRLSSEVDLVVVTDGEAVLGIGDQGIGGMNISAAKLMVYTLGAGINPHRVLPIQLDVGTHNPHLLNDPMYLGWRHERISGSAYMDFIDLFVQAVQKKLPRVFLHWEDVGRDNARHILQRYQNHLCTYNGDMQTTGVVALACILAGTIASSIPLAEQRIVIMGAGNAGIGIADQISGAMQRCAGLSEKEAKARLWLIDKAGLLIDTLPMTPFQASYTRPAAEIRAWGISHSTVVSLLDVVTHVKPTILIGCATATGAFTKEVIQTMAAHVERPLVMPLSNPSALAEAQPDDLLKWTDGKAIIATGSPYPDINYAGKWFRIPLSNNAFAFPGIGLGVIAVKAKRLTEEMLWAATQALSQCSPVHQDKMAPLLPKIAETRMISFKVALAVAETACQQGLASLPPETTLTDLIQQTIWEPRYYPYRKG